MSASSTRWGRGGTTLCPVEHYYFLPKISNGYAPTPAFFTSRQTKNARAPLDPEYIAKVALNVMAEAGIDTAEWKAHSLRGAAATHFMAKGVPDAVVQARGCWASAATMATHYARQHQLIPWTELASSPPELASWSGIVASSSSVLLRASLQSLSSNSGEEGKSGSLLDGANCAGRGVRPKVPLPESTPGDKSGGTEALTPRNIQFLDADFPIQWKAFPVCPLCSTPIMYESIFQCTICLKWVHTRCLGEEAGHDDTKVYRGHSLLSFTCRLCYMGPFAGSW